MGRVRVFLACSLDGFIAGPADELDWLTPDPDVPPPEDTFTPFLGQVGALLMGRRTYDVVSGFEGPWPYGERPVLVATHRPLVPARGTVRPVSGSLPALVAEAREAAGAGDVYLDGGALVRAALAAGLIDEITLTVAPVVLGAGIPLFAGSVRQQRLRLSGSRLIGGGFLQQVYEPVREGGARAAP